jgi:hypothetical protein
VVKCYSNTLLRLMQVYLFIFDEFLTAKEDSGYGILFCNWAIKQNFNQRDYVFVNSMSSQQELFPHPISFYIRQFVF